MLKWSDLMFKKTAIDISIKPNWNIIKGIQKKSINYLETKNLDKDTIEAAIMSATELIENAIKHGNAVPGCKKIKYLLTVNEYKIIINVINGILNDENLKAVKLHIERIINCEDPAKLYIERLQQLMENPVPGVSQLGLYRIAYEGEFELNYEYKNNILKVIAEKKLIS